jgi:hypothetical protein
MIKKEMNYEEGEEEHSVEHPKDDRDDKAHQNYAEDLTNPNCKNENKKGDD